MKAALCWTVIGITAVCLIAAAAPREGAAPGGSASSLLDRLTHRDHREEIAAAIQPILAAPPDGVPTEIWELVRAFYPPGSGPAWATSLSTAGAAHALALIRSAADHGLDPASYGERELSEQLAALHDAPAERRPVDLRQRPDVDADAGMFHRLALFDVRLTTALLTLGHDVAVGRTPADALANGWTKQRAVPDLSGTLRAAGGDISGWLDAMQPSHTQYAKLRQALKTLVAPGDAATAAIVARNLERWRWMPDDLGDNYLFVNIPSYELTAYEDEDPVLRMRVIVGKTSLRTPVLSSTMNSVVFSPYWHVPASIVADETVPKAVEDPDYLRRGGFEIVRLSKSGATPVTPDEIDWNDAVQLRQLSFRQRPGPQNALGYVKFLFPNPFNVYLHDTPGDGLFGRTRRAFSHGCIRLEEPQKLAEYVLRHDERWTEPRIVEAMHSGNEQSVKLDSSSALQIHIVYFTAWVSDEGRAIAFFPDIYGYDDASTQVR